MLDRKGLFHVLECKGTQSGIYYRDQAMEMGQKQKQCIRFEGSIRGESLVAGVYLCPERTTLHGYRWNQHPDDDESSLRVIDPSGPAIAVISESDVGRAKEIIRELGLARALNLSGLVRTAFELAWSNVKAPDKGLLHPFEKELLRRDERERWELARTELRDQRGVREEGPDNEYDVQSAAFQLDVAEDLEQRPFSRVSVKRGIASSIVSQLASSAKASGVRLREEAQKVAAELGSEKRRIVFSQTDGQLRITYAGIYYTELLLQE